MPKSEFYQVVSSGVADFQPVDLSGAFEVVMKVSAAGSLHDIPASTGEAGMPLSPTDPPLVIHSTDDRLYFVSDVAGGATLYVWVIRRRA